MEPALTSRTAQPMLAGLPTCPEADLPDDVERAANALIKRAKVRTPGAPAFFWARSILKSPQWYADLSQILANEHPDIPVEVVHPFTFFGLIHLYFEK